jgi:anti-anti-sigma regulatory factor
VKVVPGAAIDEVRVSGHVCWVMDDPAGYVKSAADLLAEGARIDHRVVFGPRGDVLDEIAAVTGATAFDPATAYPSGKLDPVIMCGILRGYADRAREDGYSGLRVVADMDWLLPFRPQMAQIISLELQLDRLIAELDVTLVCAYRTSSFDTAAIIAALTVHSAQHGGHPLPQFQFTAAGPQSWQLSGEIDLRVSDIFRAALGTAASLGECVIDVSGLRFVDVSGMRTLAVASWTAASGIRLHGTSHGLRRLWDLCGFAQAAPLVHLLPLANHGPGDRRTAPHDGS